MTQNNIIKLIQTVLLLLVVLFVFKKCNKSEYYKNAYDVQKDSLVSYVNKDGLNESKIKELELTKNDLKNELDTLKINRKTKSVTQVKTVTEFRDVLKTIVLHDTIMIDGTSVVKPIYTSEINEFWYKASIKASADSTYLDVKFYDEILIKREQKRGLFKSHPIDLTVIQQNPNTYTNGIKSYKVKSKAPLFNAGLQSGIGVNVITGKPTIYVGLGIGLNLIR